MKRIYYLLLLLPALVLAACSDDNNLPPVDVNVTVSGCTIVDDQIYVVQSEGFTVNSVTLTNHSDKKAMIGSTAYYWDNYNVGTTVEAPFSYEFALVNGSEGNHLFQVESAIYAVDYAPAVALLSYNIIVVASPDEIPGGPAPEGSVYSLAAEIRAID